MDLKTPVFKTGKTYLVSQETFFELAAKAKLTPAQEKILEHLKNGDRIKILNSHRLSGGEWTWEKAGYAGKVYKAFWNLIRIVLYKNGYEESVRYLNFMVPKNETEK